MSFSELYSFDYTCIGVSLKWFPFPFLCFTFPEFCKNLSPAEETVSELDGGMGNKKPPRRERKKLPTARASILFIC